MHSSVLIDCVHHILERNRADERSERFWIESRRALYKLVLYSMGLHALRQLTSQQRDELRPLFRCLEDPEKVSATFAFCREHVPDYQRNMVDRLVQLEDEIVEENERSRRSWS